MRSNVASQMPPSGPYYCRPLPNFRSLFHAQADMERALALVPRDWIDSGQFGCVNGRRTRFLVRLLWGSARRRRLVRLLSERRRRAFCHGGNDTRQAKCFFYSGTTTRLPTQTQGGACSFLHVAPAQPFNH